MAEKKKEKCPQCDGRKVIPGVCVCDSEWRGTQVGDDWGDCKCAREQLCPTCGGAGYVPAEVIAP